MKRPKRTHQKRVRKRELITSTLPGAFPSNPLPSAFTSSPNMNSIEKRGYSSSGSESDSESNADTISIQESEFTTLRSSLDIITLPRYNEKYDFEMPPPHLRFGRFKRSCATFFDSDRILSFSYKRFCLYFFFLLLAIGALTGLFFWLLVARHLRVNPDINQLDFVQRSKNMLLLDGKPFKFVSFNVPGLLLLEDYPKEELYQGNPICRSPLPKEVTESIEFGARCIRVPANANFTKTSSRWIPPTREEQRDAIMTIKALNGQVIRTYTLGFGDRHHVRNMGDGKERYFEPAWVAFDNALAIARSQGIRLIVPILNGNPGGFGDYRTISKWRGLEPGTFFTEPLSRKDLKDIIKFMLDRINTVNGVRYGDDSTILAWQIGNEMGGWDGPAPPDEWCVDIAQYIKSLAPNTLVMDGTLGGYEATKRYSSAVLQSSAIDIFDNHYYSGSSDYKRISLDSAFISQHDKAFILGEIGFDINSCQEMMRITMESSAISGALVWSLRYHASEGGFYTHSEGKGDIEAFHAPKDPMTLLVSDFGAKIVGKEKLASILPPPAQKAGGIDVLPISMRWFGSAMASFYIIRRSDGVIYQSNQSIFQDIAPLKEGMPVSYTITPIGIDGRENTQSPLVLDF